MAGEQTAQSESAPPRHPRRLPRRRLSRWRLRWRWPPPPSRRSPSGPRGHRCASRPGLRPSRRACCERSRRGTGCRVRIVPPLAPGAVPAAGVDIVEMRGDDAGALIASGRLAVIKEPTVNGLGDVPGRLRDAVRDAGGGLRAVPYLWSPQLLLARRSVFGSKPPTSLRALFSRQRGGARRAARLAARARDRGALPRHRRSVRARRATS